MSRKNKSVVVKFQFKQRGRGEYGDEFHSATYRFPLKEAQAFERRAISMGTTRAQLLMQLVEAFNAQSPDPGKSVKAEKTKYPTVWGESERKQFFKKKGLKEVPKFREAPKTRKGKPSKQAKATKAKAAKTKLKLTKKPEVKAVVKAEKPKVASLLQKLKKRAA